MSPEQAGTPPSVERGGAPGIMVSPELFDLASRWSAESLGLRAQAASGSTLDLVSYARATAPELTQEAAQVVSRSLSAATETRTAMENCTCTILSAFDRPSNVYYGGGWNVSVQGAAHSGNIYQNLSGTLREQMTSNLMFNTQLRTRLNCFTAGGAACSGTCSARLYSDVLYSSRVDALADTGGIWNKASTAQVVDGVKLDLRTPFGTGSRIYEKAAALSHYASSTTFQPQEYANVVKAALNIYVAIETNDPAKISSDLVSEGVKSLFGLIHRSGSNGQSTQMLNIRYQSAFESQPIIVSYSSTDNLYYGLDLTSDVLMRTRGYGGWHKAEGRVASSLMVAAYIDNFACSTDVVAPRPTGFWRYDSFANAPYTSAMLQDLTRNFFAMGGFPWVDVSQQQGIISR